MWCGGFSAGVRNSFLRLSPGCNFGGVICLDLLALASWLHLALTLCLLRRATGTCSIFTMCLKWTGLSQGGADSVCVGVVLPRRLHSAMGQDRVCPTRVLRGPSLPAASLSSSFASQLDDSSAWHSIIVLAPRCTSYLCVGSGPDYAGLGLAHYVLKVVRSLAVVLHISFGASIPLIRGGSMA